MPAGEKIELHIRNADAAASEFESAELHREKLVPAGKEVVVFIGPLRAGRYEFFDDFHPLVAGPHRGEVIRHAAGLPLGVRRRRSARSGPAFAELQVRMPEVDYLEFEFEHNGLVTFDTKGSPLRNAQSYTNSIGYGVLPWWEIELEGEMASGGGQHYLECHDAGEHLPAHRAWPIFLHPRLLLRIFAIHAARRAQRVTFGPIIQKELNDVFGLDTLHTLNLFLSPTSATTRRRTPASSMPGSRWS